MRIAAADVSEDRLDKGRHRRALGKDDQAAKKQKHDHDWKQPEFLSNPHESPKFRQEAHTSDLFNCLKLVRHRIGFGPGRLPVDPVTGRIPVDFSLQRVFAHYPQNQCRRRDGKKKTNPMIIGLVIRCSRRPNFIQRRFAGASRTG
jgi:hypothetical protein